MLHIKEGDPKAFRRLFDAYYPGLVEYAYRFLYDQAVSEDLVQQLFIDLWENRTSIIIKQSLKAYLYTSVRNRSLNHLKSLEVVDTSYLLDITISLSTDEKSALHDEQEKAAMHEKAISILEQLPEKMRLIFRLKVIDEYSYADIAQELDISINTVKTQLKRARSKIAEINNMLLLFWSFLKSN